MDQRPAPGLVVTDPEWGRGVVQRTNSGPGSTVIVDFDAPPARRVAWARLETAGEATYVFAPIDPSDMARADLVAGRAYEVLHMGRRQRFRRKSVLTYVGRGAHAAGETVWTGPAGEVRLDDDHVSRITEVPDGTAPVLDERAEFAAARRV